MGNEIANQVVSLVTSIISMIPEPVLIGLIVLIALLVCGYENKKKAERAAEAAKRRKTRTPSNKDSDNNGTIS